MVLKRFQFSLFQILVHLASLTPLAVAIFDFLTDPSFSGNVQRLEFRTGRLAIIWLILSLVGSPLYWLTGYYEFFKARKPLGRYAFLYAFLHFLAFLTLDYAWDLRLIWLSLGGTLYLLVGVIAFIILLLMAITSNPQSQAFLKRNWDRLHRFVYLAAALSVLHYFLIEKSDIRWPLIASAILGLLLLVRLPPIRERITLHKPVKKVTISTRTRKAS